MKKFSNPQLFAKMENRKSHTLANESFSTFPQLSTWKTFKNLWKTVLVKKFSTFSTISPQKNPKNCGKLGNSAVYFKFQLFMEKHGLLNGEIVEKTGQNDFHWRAVRFCAIVFKNLNFFLKNPANFS